MAAKKQSEKIPVRVQHALDRLKGGERLVKWFRHKETGEAETLFRFEPSGKNLGPDTALKIVRGGYVIPEGDGLFGADSSQTWRLA